MAVLVPERQVEFWTNVEILIALRAEGHEVQCFPITQKLERTLGVDALFAGGSTVKLFGLQYKALYAGSPDYWSVTPAHQLKTLRSSNWAYYCMSDMRRMRQAATALHHARFVDPQRVDPSVRTVDTHGSGILLSSSTWYRRWSAFYSMLVGCQLGVLVNSAAEAQAALGQTPEALEIVDAIFLVASRDDGTGVPVPAGAVMLDGTLSTGDRIDDDVQ